VFFYVAISYMYSSVLTDNKAVCEIQLDNTFVNTMYTLHYIMSHNFYNLLKLCPRCFISVASSLRFFFG